jgi:hypothetical protein
MQIKRGSAPPTVEREIDVELSREEVLAILGAYARRKFGTDKFRFDDIQVIANKDAAGQMALSGVTLLGVEVLTLQYPEDFAPVKVTPTAPPTPAPVVPAKQPVIHVGPPAVMPAPLKDLAKAAAEQAEQAQK